MDREIMSTLTRVRKSLMGTRHEETSDVVELGNFVAVTVDDLVAVREVKSILAMRGSFWGMQEVKFITNYQRDSYLVLVEKRKEE